MSKILKCNFAKNEESAVQAIEAIEYVQASMFEKLYNDSISRLKAEYDKDDKALSAKKSDFALVKDKASDELVDDIKELEGNISRLNRQIDDIEEKRNEQQARRISHTTAYTAFMSNVGGASNDHVTNDEDAVNRVLRLYAASTESRLLPYVLGDNLEQLYSNVATFKSRFDDINTVLEKSFAANGARIYTKAQLDTLKSLNTELSAMIYNLFSIPVATPFTNAIKIKLKNKHFGVIHNAYINAAKIDVEKIRRKLKKAEKEEKDKQLPLADYKYKGLTLDGAIKLVKKQKDGTPVYDYSKFERIILAVAMDIIFTSGVRNKVINE